MDRWRWAVLGAAAAAILLSVWQLQAGRAGLVREALAVGTTPATVWRLPGAGPAPVAVIAHGFAGSEALMEGFAQTLARAGYIAVTFDFLGHGRNPVPMSGDVTAVDGTTRLLMDETAAVAEAALALPGADGRLALIGHSMASDIVVRQAIRDARAGAVVAVSMFSLAVTATEPRNLLVLTGAWEGALAEEALCALRLADPAAVPGRTLGDPSAGTGRRAVLVPGVEHVGVLYSPVTLAETAAWLDAAFGRDGAAGVVPPRRGGWIVLLLLGILGAGWPLAALARRWRAANPPGRLAPRQFAVAVALPALAAPVILWPLPTHFLPVLVADYLALHFGLQGALGLALLAWFGGLGGRGGASVAPAIGLGLGVAAFGIGGFGWAIDSYFTQFFPVGARVAVIAAVAAGALPYMLADAILTEGGRAPLWRVVALRGAALLSLGLAVALDFEALFFLILILPLILVFFLVFWTVGGWIGRATWRPAAGGLGLGLTLAWALGVTFPLFAG
jgi:hypothetical protein